MTVDQARAAGWDGVASTSLQYRYTNDIRKHKIHDSEFKIGKIRLRSALNISIPDDTDLIEWTRDICDSKGLEKLASFLDLAGHEAVIVIPTIVDHWRNADGQLQLPYGYRPGSSQNLFHQSICHEKFLTIGSHFQMSSRLRTFATEFISKAFPRGQPFAAAHIRPYPDECLLSWTNNPFQVGYGDVKGNKSKCVVLDMENIVKIKIKAIVKSVGGRGVGLFVMAHPSIRQGIDEILSTHSIRATYLDSESSAVKAIEMDFKWRHGTSSLLLLLEQSVAVLANEFVGTHLSSATWNVVDQRDVVFRGSKKGSRPQFFVEEKQEHYLQDLYSKCQLQQLSNNQPTRISRANQSRQKPLAS